MGLTYRSDLDRPLNNTEIDNNFRYFTGSHDITGSLTVSGSTITIGSNVTTGSLIVSNSLTIIGKFTITQVKLLCQFLVIGLQINYPT